jgi:hypothetical protein
VHASGIFEQGRQPPVYVRSSHAHVKAAERDPRQRDISRCLAESFIHQRLLSTNTHTLAREPRGDFVFPVLLLIDYLQH